MAVLLMTSLALACTPSTTPQQESLAAGPALPSWNEGAAKQAIIDFVGRVTDPASPDFVPEPERIAVFDNDGTLWSEQPLYFQLVFAIDRVKALAPEHPEWSDAAALQGGARRRHGRRSPPRASTASSSS